MFVKANRPSYLSRQISHYVYQGKVDTIFVNKKGPLYLSRQNGHCVCQGKRAIISLRAEETLQLSRQNGHYICQGKVAIMSIKAKGLLCLSFQATHLIICYMKFVGICQLVRPGLICLTHDRWPYACQDVDVPACDISHCEAWLVKACAFYSTMVSLAQINLFGLQPNTFINKNNCTCYVFQGIGVSPCWIRIMHRNFWIQAHAGSCHLP